MAVIKPVSCLEDKLACEILGKLGGRTVSNILQSIFTGVADEIRPGKNVTVCSHKQK